MRASTEASARRSPKTRAVMPTLVAVSAAADEQRLVAVSCRRRRPTPMPAANGNDDADRRHGQRRTADRAQLPKVHLHADLEQQQDHAELAEDPQDLVRTDETEHRRTDEDAGEDLADDRRNADSAPTPRPPPSPPAAPLPRGRARELRPHGET